MKAAEVPSIARVAYVMTHYPRVALTFIAGEIDELERRGIHILPMAMNSPDKSDLVDPTAQTRSRRTLYFKASKGSIFTALARYFLLHPIAMSRLLGKAFASSQFDLELTARRLAHFGYAARAARDCERAGVRHLHAQFGQAPATIAWFAAEILNFGKSITASWSFTIHGFHDFVDEKAARLDLKAQSARFVVCVSDFTKSQLCRIADPKTWHRFHVIRCGIDLSTFRFRGVQALRPTPKILIVGRLSPEKGHIILLNAVERLACRGIQVQIQILGDGPFASHIRDAAERLKLSDRLTFLGELMPAEIPQALAEADIFCMPSFAEGLPVSIMEAMAVGVPVIATWIGGIPELAVNEVTALTVPPGNSDALAGAIERLLSNEQLRKALIQSGRVAVERLHAREANVQGLLELFQQHATPSL